MNQERICITGGPRTGKTTLARELVEQLSIEPRHTDILIETHSWSGLSLAVATWFDADGPWVIEGVAVSRALRKWHEQNPDRPPPVDRVIFLREPHEVLNQGQAAMAKGVETVHLQIESWLAEHGIETEYRP